MDKESSQNPTHEEVRSRLTSQEIHREGLHESMRKLTERLEGVSDPEIIEKANKLIRGVMRELGIQVEE